mgnify:CR=1 FL=1
MKAQSSGQCTWTSMHGGKGGALWRGGSRGLDSQH